jgi:ring-1,2-phenylacetyl-CoA epoxidase subunit PaaD
VTGAPAGGPATSGGPATAGGPGAAYAVAAQTPDPELPMVTIADLGILRAVDVTADGAVVTITPTYSGCPAMREIGADVAHRLVRAGFGPVTVKTQLAPPWSSDWITAEGRRKLAEAGIAPPSPALVRGVPGGRSPGQAGRSGPVPVKLSTVPSDVVRCPRCGSLSTRETARFGATACKSLHRCEACGEPFEAVKAL